jgi:hypothetical protein
LKFFLTPFFNLRSLFLILKSVFKILIKSPDLLKIFEFSLDESEKIILILKEKNKIFSFLIILEDGKIKKIGSLNYNFENLDIKGFRKELEKKYSIIKQIIFIDKEVHKNIIREVNKSKKHPFLTIVSKFQEEIKNGRIVIYPLPPQISLFLELNLEEIILKFSPLFF